METEGGGAFAPRMCIAPLICALLGLSAEKVFFNEPSAPQTTETNRALGGIASPIETLSARWTKAAERPASREEGRGQPAPLTSSSRARTLTDPARVRVAIPRLDARLLEEWANVHADGVGFEHALDSTLRRCAGSALSF
eukprot:8972926-Pyramimonas_sp.AAC.1